MKQASDVDEWEEEEAYILLDFGSSQVAVKVIQQALRSMSLSDDFKLKINNIQSASPTIEIGDALFQSTYHEPLGTHLVLNEKLEEVAVVDRIVKCKQVIKDS